MNKVKWGVIGCGGIADRRTIPGMMLSDEVELVAVMDANLEAAQRVKEKYGAKYAFDNEADLLALDEIEVVYIASPVFCHKAQALAAAKAKKDILIEKPVGLTAAEAEEKRFEESVKDKKDADLTAEEREMRESLSKRVTELHQERDARLEEIGGENRKVRQIIDLALLSNGMLKGKNLTDFIQRSISLIE